MSVFLDYLNEDLNRTTKKQYIEMKEKGKDESDEDCAKRYWDCNLKRNDSIITDLFCGQFKSTITCPDCGFINITFDPFETLNLPMLSQRRSRSSMWDIINFDYYYVPKYGLRKSYHIIIKNFLENTMFGSVIDRIKKDKDCPIHDKLDNALIVDMYNNKIYGNASNTNEVRQLNSHGEYIVGYPYNKSEDKMQIPVFFYSKEYSNDKENMSFYPRMIFDKSDMTVGDLKKKIYFNLRKYILSPFLKDNEEKDNVSLEI
jgi:ubiquitin carboxyl-terminal hydrolase 4/11/15